MKLLFSLSSVVCTVEGKYSYLQSLSKRSCNIFNLCDVFQLTVKKKTKYKSFCARLRPRGKNKIFARAVGIQLEKNGVTTQFFEIIESQQC